ncbi:hypothetical protein Hanom_Chr10g00882551 [Helianthus anomalus]
MFIKIKAHKLMIRQVFSSPKSPKVAPNSFTIQIVTENSINGIIKHHQNGNKCHKLLKQPSRCRNLRPSAVGYGGQQFQKST